MEDNKEPTNWDIYQCILDLSNRLFNQRKITICLIVISIINLLLCLIQMILVQ